MVGWGCHTHRQEEMVLRKIYTASCLCSVSLCVLFVVFRDSWAVFFSKCVLWQSAPLVTVMRTSVAIKHAVQFSLADPRGSTRDAYPRAQFLSFPYSFQKSFSQIIGFRPNSGVCPSPLTPSWKSWIRHWFCPVRCTETGYLLLPYGNISLMTRKIQLFWLNLHLSYIWFRTFFKRKKIRTSEGRFILWSINWLELQSDSSLLTSGEEFVDRQNYSFMLISWYV